MYSLDSPEVTIMCFGTMLCFNLTVMQTHYIPRTNSETQRECKQIKLSRFLKTGAINGIKDERVSFFFVATT